MSSGYGFADGGYFRERDEAEKTKNDIALKKAKEEWLHLYGTHYRFKLRWPFILKMIGHPDIQTKPLWNEKDLV